MLDRGLQLRILQALAGLNPVGTYDLATAIGEPDIDETRLIVNALYLQDHELIQCGFRRSNSISASNDFHESQESIITFRGLDFLADDGGLTAILDVVTVKLHDDTVKELLTQRINESDLPSAEKGLWLEALQKLPAETTKHLVLKLLDLGLAEAPRAIGAIGKYLGF